MTDAPNLLFVGALLVLAQAMFVLVLMRVPAFVRGGFYPSYAAMTFPFVITATALMLSLQAFANAGVPLPSVLNLVCVAETIFAAGMVAFVVFRYACFFANLAIEAWNAHTEDLSLAPEPE